MRTENLYPAIVEVDFEAVMWAVAGRSQDDVLSFILDLVDHGFDDWSSIKDLHSELTNMLKSAGELE